MGQVYLARDTQLHRTVAIKLVDPRRQSPQELVREARLAASLDHPSICTIHGVDYLGEEPFLVMEHVKGMPLSKVIRSRRSVSVTTALDFARQIVAAVAHAHDRGVIHGDLKSSNIMVGPDGHVTILDFGLAVRRDAGAGGRELDTTRLSPSSGGGGHGALHGAGNHSRPVSLLCNRTSGRSACCCSRWWSAAGRSPAARPTRWRRTSSSTSARAWNRVDSRPNSRGYRPVPVGRPGRPVPVGARAGLGPRAAAPPPATGRGDGKP